MLTPVHHRESDTTLRSRQREVEKRLALFGLQRGPHRLLGHGVNLEQDRISRLRAALEGLGPVFCSFGRYLSTRVDLLPAKDCRELATLPDHAEESAAHVVRNLIKLELGSSPEDVFLTFEAEPFSSGLFYQQHRACLSDGQAVTVKLIHPEAEEFLKHDLQLLPLLKGAFVGRGSTDSQVDRMIEDFRNTLLQRTNFVLQAEALATLAKDTEVFGILRVQIVHRQFSTSRMLTLERLPGNSVAELLSLLESGREPATEIPGTEERHNLARRLWVVWLRQALLGSLLPVEPSPGNVTILPNQQIAFVDGGFATLAPETKTNLWDYLLAVVTDNPDLACSSLLKELDRGKDAISEDELRQRFRQIVPFRDSEWANEGNSNYVAEHLFLHWKLAGDRGFRTRPGLPAFYQGLFTMDRMVRRLAPNSDAFQEALQDVRLLTGIERFRELMTMRELGEQMDRYFAIMMDLPQRLDETLTQMAEGHAELRQRLDQAGSPPAVQRWNGMIALLLALTAFVVLSFGLGGDTAGQWQNALRWSAFGLLGALCLRAIFRWT